MSKKRPLDNTPLTAMLIVGAVLILIGLIFRANNNDAGSYDEAAAGEFIGTAIALFGTMLLSLGWAAAAICRQIVNAQSDKTPQRS